MNLGLASSFDMEGSVDCVACIYCIYCCCLRKVS